MGYYRMARRRNEGMQDAGNIVRLEPRNDEDDMPFEAHDGRRYGWHQVTDDDGMRWDRDGDPLLTNDPYRPGQALNQDGQSVLCAKPGCGWPISYRTNSVSGLWYHDHSGERQCDGSREEAFPGADYYMGV